MSLVRDHFGRGALGIVSRLATWIALAYLGYWAAVFLQNVLVPAVIYPALGSPVEEWRLTAFRAVLFSGSPDTLPFSGRTHGLIVLLAQALLLLWALRLSIAASRILWRTWILHAAFWTLLLRIVGSAFLAFVGRGSLAVLLQGAISSRSAQIGAATATALLLLPFGVAVARRLISASSHLQFGSRSAVRSIALLILPACLMMGGRLNFQLRPAGLRTWIYLAVPGLFCLLVSLLALTRRGRVPAAPTTGVSPQGVYATVIPVLAAVLAYGGLQNAQQLRQWSYVRTLETVTTGHYQVRYDPNAFPVAFVAEFAQERERAFAALTARLLHVDSSLNEKAFDQVRIRVILYDDFPRKRAATRSDRPFMVEGATVHALIHGYIQTLDPAADAAALLHETWGNAASPLIRDWVARFLVGRWRGENIEAAAARIQQEEGHYLVAQLLEATADSFFSPLVREPLGAAWIAAQHAGHGTETIKKLYQRSTGNLTLATIAELLGTQPEQIERGWTNRMQGANGGHEFALRPSPKWDPEFFYRGMTFSHEGWGGRRGGYTGPEAEKQLQLLAAMGVNAIAVVPYGFQRTATSTTISAAGTDETDEELTQALFVARRLGMKVMLKPHIWVGGGVFTGEIRLADPAARANWFRSYRAFLLHYARLAEQEGFDMLCIGNELSGVIEHAAEWRELISQVRRIYRGPVTYAANWGPEFESVSFWADLDFIGLNHYYPLRSGGASAAVQVHADQLVSGAEEVARTIADISQKYGRPVLFTEIGYPSLRGGTAEPWNYDRRRGVALQEQAAAYEACLRVYSGQRWLRGMFWWNWPSNGRGGGEQDTSNTPMRKPAADVLRAWYGKLANGLRTDASVAP